MKPLYIKLIFALLFGGYVLRAVWNPEVWSLLDPMNLIFHEAGHTLFRVFMTEWLEVAGGSMFQVLLPLGIGVYFVVKRDLYAASLMLMWAGQSMGNVSVYAADALRMELPLISQHAQHDWNHLLWMFGALRHTDTTATVLRWSGQIMAFVGMGAVLRLSFIKTEVLIEKKEMQMKIESD